jgi:hypothetical protein
MMYDVFSVSNIISVLKGWIFVVYYGLPIINSTAFMLGCLGGAYAIALEIGL